MSDRPDSPEERVREMLERVLDAMDLDAEVEVQVDSETVRARIEGEDVAVLIGRRGETIDALQHLAVRVASGPDSPNLRVQVDAGGYRAEREQALHEEADRAADEAIRSGRPVALDALPAAERRVVHEYLRERGDVDTYSEGDEPDRHLVVAPAGA